MEAEVIDIAELLSYIESTDHINTVILTDYKLTPTFGSVYLASFRGTPIASTILDNILKCTISSVDTVSCRSWRAKKLLIY